MKNKILFLTATHGDERLGYKALKKLEKEYPRKLHWVVGNEKALKLKTRFVDMDLNRAAPGKKEAKEYERRRAYELIEISKKYHYVIDIHDTKADTGIFTIVSNPKLINLSLASVLPIKNVVIWAAEKSKVSGPLAQFMNCGIGIECGPRNSKKIQKKLYSILKFIISKEDLFSIKSISPKNYFQVYGKINKDEITSDQSKRIKDFKKTEINGEIFYPLLVGEYKNILCYKMKKINFWDKFSY